MRSKMMSKGSTRSFAVVFEMGDEVTEGLTDLALESRVRTAHFTGIGALSDALLGFYHLDKKEYEEIAVNEQTELLSLTGNIALYEGEPRVHAHVVLGRPDGTALGGHLFEAHVRPTVEVMLVESPGRLDRQFDDDIGLPLIRI